jgi:hypothetical protein
MDPPKRLRRLRWGFFGLTLFVVESIDEVIELATDMVSQSWIRTETSDGLFSFRDVTLRGDVTGKFSSPVEDEVSFGRVAAASAE